MVAEQLVWESERFYWGVLQPRRAGRRAPSDAQLRFLLEPLLPEPIDAVHAVFEPLGDGKWLAVAVPRSALAEHVPQGVLSLRPETVPPELGVEVDSARLELLQGAAIPQVVERQRRTRAIVAIAAGVAAVGAVLYGVEQRVAQHERLAADIHQQRLAAIEERLGPQVRASPLPPELVLAAEVRSMERTRLPVPGDGLPQSVAPLLAQVVNTWPQALQVRVEALQASAGQVVVRGKADGPSEVESLASSYQSTPGWRVEQPSVRDARGEASFVLRLSQEAKP